MILAHIVRGFSFGTRVMVSSRSQISRDLEEARPRFTRPLRCRSTPYRGDLACPCEKLFLAGW